MNREEAYNFVYKQQKDNEELHFTVVKALHNQRSINQNGHSFNGGDMIIRIDNVHHKVKAYVSTGSVRDAGIEGETLTAKQEEELTIWWYNENL